jgi:hypothetical protein
MNHKPIETIQPWYRHRWPWMLMLGPFLVIVAGAVTTYLAVRSNDGLVDDDYYKQGLTVNQVTARDRRAVELGLHAKVAFDAERRLIRVSLQSRQLAAFPGSLKLNIAHPTRSGLDQSLLLHADGPASYSAGIGAPLAGRWHVSLEDDRREWRLAEDWVVEKQPVLTLPATQGGLAPGVALSGEGVSICSCRIFLPAG